MKLLGFDTATDITAVCVATEGRFFERASPEVSEERHPKHTQELLPEITEVLQRAGVSLRDIDEIAVGVGPGTYTGLRIGVATARALAQSLDLKLTPVSTLEVVAMGIADDCAVGDVVLPVIDAKRDEVFSCAYQPIQDKNDTVLKPLSEPFVSKPLDIAKSLGDIEVGSAVAAGDGAVRYRTELQSVGIKVLDDENGAHIPIGRNICKLAARIDSIPLEEIAPNYLRLPDAELTLRAGKLNV